MHCTKACGHSVLLLTMNSACMVLTKLSYTRLLVADAHSLLEGWEG